MDCLLRDPRVQLEGCWLARMHACHHCILMVSMPCFIDVVPWNLLSRKHLGFVKDHFPYLLNWWCYFVRKSNYMIYYHHWLIYDKPTLYFQEQPNLIMMEELVPYLVCWYFIRHFCMYAQRRPGHVDFSDSVSDVRIWPSLDRTGTWHVWPKLGRVKLVDVLFNWTKERWLWFWS